jgi:hypothetical protein
MPTGISEIKQRKNIKAKHNMSKAKQLLQTIQIMQPNQSNKSQVYFTHMDTLRNENEVHIAILTFFSDKGARCHRSIRRRSRISSYVLPPFC